MGAPAVPGAHVIASLPMRAFSLIEVMVVVAILGVISALALPQLLPEVHKAQLNANTEAAANFLARARAEAMTSKRCVAVTVVANELIAQRLNSFDCDTTTAAAPTAPFIDGGSGALIRFANLRPSTTAVTFAMQREPPEMGAFDQLRIRPTGRVFGKNASMIDDDAMFSVTHSGLAVGNVRRILYEGHGLICTFARGANPTGPNFTCPGS